MLIHCRKLDFSGLGPATVFAFRFPVYILLAATGWFLQLDYKGPVDAGEVATAILIGFAIMAFPLYAMQKAVSGVGVLLLSTITALGPLVVFCLQLIESRVAFSGFTLAGLLVYSLGALLAVSSLVGGIWTMRREIVLPMQPTAGQKKQIQESSRHSVNGPPTPWGSAFANLPVRTGVAERTRLLPCRGRMSALRQCQDGDLENRLRQLRTGPAIAEPITIGASLP